MAKITDPDSLSVYVHPTTSAGAGSEEVVILTGPKTLELRIAGNLDDTAPGKTSGVTARALYSFLKEEWLNGTDASTLRRFRFPLKMIFEGSFIWVNGWAPQGVQTRDLVRDAGFQEGVTLDEYACMISLGTVDNPAVDLAYYTQAAGFTVSPTDYDKTGELNENVDITGATTYFKSFLREPNKIYGEYNLLVELGLSAITYQAYSFPLSNGTDLKATETDANVASQTPYTNMEINYLKGTTFETATATTYVAEEVLQDTAGRWFFVTTGGTVDAAGVLDYTNNGGTAALAAYFGEEQIGANYYAFNRVVTCATGTDIEAYTFMQWSLRQTGDINADNVGITAGQGGYGTVNGDVAALLGAYVGDTLYPKPGVLLRGFDTNSTNNIVHSPIDVDTGGLNSEDIPLSWTEVPFPFVSAGNFNFSSNLTDELDAETYYTVYFAYITRTVSTGIAITTSSGSTATIDYSADAGALNFLTSTTGGADDASADYIFMSGFTNPENNGFWFLTSDPATNTFNATKADNATVVDETAGNSITVDENPFESPEAIIVDDNSDVPLTGQITAPSIGWDFNYTNNNQGGRTPATPAPIIVVAQALDGAEWVEATHTITAATGQNIAINANDERNYVNPA